MTKRELIKRFEGKYPGCESWANDYYWLKCSHWLIDTVIAELQKENERLEILSKDFEFRGLVLSPDVIVAMLEYEKIQLQEKYDKLNERVEIWKRIAEIRQYRNELNLHLIPGINEDALDSELYSLNLEEEKLLSILTPEEMEMNDE